MSILVALLGVAVAVTGLFIPWPIASVACGAVGAVLLAKAWMMGVNG